MEETKLFQWRLTQDGASVSFLYERLSDALEAAFKNLGEQPASRWEALQVSELAPCANTLTPKELQKRVQELAVSRDSVYFNQTTFDKKSRHTASCHSYVVLRKTARPGEIVGTHALDLYGVAAGAGVIRLRQVAVAVAAVNDAKNGRRHFDVPLADRGEAVA